jgi:hypothetical protein
MKRYFGLVFFSPSGVYAQFFSNWPQTHFPRQIELLEIGIFLLLILVFIAGGYLYRRDRSVNEPYRHQENSDNKDERVDL